VLYVSNAVTTLDLSKWRKFFNPCQQLTKKFWIVSQNLNMDYVIGLLDEENSDGESSENYCQDYSEVVETQGNTALLAEGRAFAAEYGGKATGALLQQNTDEQDDVHDN